MNTAESDVKALELLSQYKGLPRCLQDESSLILMREPLLLYRNVTKW